MPLTAGPAAVRAPAAHVVRAGHDTGPDALGDPGPGHEVADLGLHPDQVAGALDPQPGGVGGVDPERVGVRELVEPLGVGGAGVDLGRQAEGGQQHHLVLGEVAGGTWL